MASFNEIDNAFEFVSSNMYGMNSAVLCKDTGKIFYQSDLAVLNEIEDAEAMLDRDNCVDIPHKNDLELGKNLVFEFVEERLPKKMGLVDSMFRHPGAYSNYKALLESEGILQAWYDFENTMEEKALRQWCKDNNIKLEE
jgi:hypothetical protein